MPYLKAIPTQLRLFVGVAEVLGAVGLVLPGLFGIFPWLTPLAALGLMLIMGSAIVFHILRREYPNIILNAILLILAAVVAYGRFVIAPL